MYPVAFLFIAQLVLLLLSVTDASSGASQNSIDIDPMSLALLATAGMLAYSLWPTSTLVNDWLVPVGFLALGLLFLEVTGSSDEMVPFVWLTVALYLAFLLLMHFTRFAHRAIATLAFFFLFLLWFASPL